MGKLEAALQASHGRVNELEALLAEVRKAHMETEKTNYDLTTYCDALQSDNMLQRQELDQKNPRDFKFASSVGNSGTGNRKL